MRYRVFLKTNQLNKLPKNVFIEQKLAGFVTIVCSEEDASTISKYFPIKKLELQTNYKSFCHYGQFLNIPENPSFKVLQFHLPLPASWREIIKSHNCQLLCILSTSEIAIFTEQKEFTKQLCELNEVASIRNFIPHISLELSRICTQFSKLKTIQYGLIENRKSLSQNEFLNLVNLSVTASFFNETFSSTALSSLKDLGISRIFPIDDDSFTIHLGDQANIIHCIQDILNLIGLKSLEKKQIKEPTNSVAKTIVAKDVAMPKPQGSELTGKGEILAISDTGIDTGNKDTIHEDFRGRILEIQSFPIAPSYGFMVENSGTDDGAADLFSGHGTHVAGCAVGNGHKSKILALRDPSVENLEGVAPEAHLIFQAVEQKPKWKLDTVIDSLTRNIKLPPNTLFGIPDELRILFQAAYDVGARTHLIGWGGGEQGAYDQQCFQIDEYVWNKRDFLSIIAAGNTGVDKDSIEGVDAGSIESPAVAKNCLTVGATENMRPDQILTKYGDWWTVNFPNAPYNEDLMADNFNEVAAFSSRGPVATGRWKPDVVAPGSFIVSTRSSQMPNNNFAWGSYPQAKSDYVYNGGSSMAASFVAGCALLIRQYLRRDKNLSNPSAALLKGAIIHSCIYIPQRNSQVQFQGWADNGQGWGRVDLSHYSSRENYYFDEALGLETGEIKDYEFYVHETIPYLKATMVYTDFPGEQLVNNLNLFLYSPDGEHYVGNDFAQSGELDELNNVESVRIENPILGKWLLRVSATDVIEPKQDFALIISGQGVNQVTSK